MHAVFLDRQTFSTAINIDVIKSQVSSLTCYDLTSAEQTLSRCRDADIIITNKVLITKALMAQLPKLKLICVAATGTNNIDLTAAKEHNITVMNVAGYSTPSVSQYVFAQLLEFYGKTSDNNAKVANGAWPNSATFCIHSARFDELAGKTLGIVGFGDIAKKVVSIAQAFDMKVLLSERPNTQPIRQGRVSFETMLAQADVISLHCPLTPETDKLFNAQVLKQMKPDALLINTARGGVVDSQALYHALKTKQIGGAILDVLEQEPPPADHILLQEKMDNLAITAHIAWASSEAQQRLINLIAENIMAFKQ